jgi:hypothetical protein
MQAVENQRPAPRVNAPPALAACRSVAALASNLRFSAALRSAPGETRSGLAALIADGGPLTLTAVLADSKRRAAVVRDVERIVDEEVAARRGIQGVALRAGYAAFRRLRPGIVRVALDRLLPLFAPVIDRHWEAAVASGDPEGWFEREAEAIADGLLAVTDAVSHRITNPVALGLYRSLRGQARPHVATGVTRIPPLLRKHVSRAV